MPLAPGDRVDRYQVVDFLGSGGMGEVYAAHDSKLQRKVALKILRVDQGLATDGRARLLREARAAAKLSHPNVLAVFDVGEVTEPGPLEGLAYIAMELVVGASLRTFVGDESVALEQRVAWLRDVARALAVAHAAGIVHRDIKPENVMIRSDGLVKVLDFGIARRAPAAAVDPTSSTEAHSMPVIDVRFAVAATEEAPSTTAGSAAGTLLYMAPEQLRGDPVDGRTDQFGWGVLAYELLAGAPPWGQTTTDAIAIVSKVMSHVPPDLSEDGRVPRSLSVVVARALEKSASQRFPSMDALITALERWERSVAPPARPSARWRWAVPTSVAAALGAIALIAIGTARAPQAQPPSTSSAPATAPADTGALGVAMTDHPTPKSRSPEAAASYAGALQLLRDGSFIDGLDELRHAVTLDPSLAAGYLRLVLFSLDLSSATSHEDYAALSRLRASLDERDATLLPVAEKYVSAGRDAPESMPLLDALAQRYPRDAEIAFLRESSLMLADRGDDAVRAMDAALALDPASAAPLAWAVFTSETDLSARIDRCLAITPASMTCLLNRAVTYELAGQCDKAEDDVRRMIEIAPRNPRGYEKLARILAAKRAPVESVRVALDAMVARGASHPETYAKAYEDLWLALLVGDLDAADRALDAVESLVARESEVWPHSDVALLRAMIAQERGDHAGEMRALETFERQAPAWSGGISQAQILLLYERRRAGKLSDADFHAKLDGVSIGRDASWAMMFAQTPDEAAYALARTAKVEPPNRAYEPYTGVWGVLPGRMMLLLGRTDEALTWLRQATSACSVMAPSTGPGPLQPYTIWHLQAERLLGEALEKKGDRQGACEAYADVLERWQSAKPRSITFEEARARSKSLRCAR